MKINKQEKETFIESLFEDTDGTLDTADSVSKIADEIVDSTADATEGEVIIDDASAKAVASEIKDAADTFEADAAAVDAGADDYLGVENIVTKTLDLAYAKALKNKRRGGKFNCNVLISGLPGSGKTASVDDWARKNHINLVSVNAKNNDLDAYINGYTTKDPDDPHWTTQAFSKNLLRLDEPNSVLFLDEYNRQVKPQIRASLLTLINEHKIVGDGPNGMHRFDNLLFTVVAINPSVDTDKGAAPLNDAEKTRFLYKLKHMDSDPASTTEFLTRYYGKQIAKLNKDDEYYAEDLEDYLRTLDLGLFIVSHPLFAYDTEDDLKTLFYEHYTMLNQRTLTEALNACDGDVEVLKHWIEYSSDFLPKNIEMFENILRTYVAPSLEELCKTHAIKADDIPVSGAAADDTTSSGTETRKEDDADFFVGGDMIGKVRAKNPYEVELVINDVISKW